MNYDDDCVSIAVPGKMIKDVFVPAQCQRYKRDYNITIPEWQDTCTKDMFINEIERCSEWVFDEHERTIVNDVSNKKYVMKNL